MSATTLLFSSSSSASSIPKSSLNNDKCNDDRFTLNESIFNNTGYDFMENDEKKENLKYEIQLKKNDMFIMAEQKKSPPHISFEERERIIKWHQISQCVKCDGPVLHYNHISDKQYVVKCTSKDCGNIIVF